MMWPSQQSTEKDGHANFSGPTTTTAVCSEECRTPLSQGDSKEHLGVHESQQDDRATNSPIHTAGERS